METAGTTCRDVMFLFIMIYIQILSNDWVNKVKNVTPGTILTLMRYLNSFARRLQGFQKRLSSRLIIKLIVGSFETYTMFFRHNQARLGTMPSKCPGHSPTLQGSNVSQI